MLSHDQIWEALDRLAERHELTPSGLARRAGLDPTSFNKSKRLSADGRLRWPSTESIAKVLDATGASMEQFMAFMRPDAGSGQQEGAFPQRGGSIPLLGFAQAGAGGFFDDGGFPAGQGWDVVEFPAAPAQKAGVYALEVQGESMMPLYRDGQEQDPDVADLIHRLHTLTPQQSRVLTMLGEGLLNKQIAYELGVSEATIKAHVSAILLKLDVDSRTQAVIQLGKINMAMVA